MGRAQFLTDESISVLQRLVGLGVHRLYAPKPDVAGAHLAAWTLSMLSGQGDFVNFSCEWSETPHFMNDSWQITVAEASIPLKIATDEKGALLGPCTISMYHAKPIRKIEVFSYTNVSDNDGAEETVNYDQAILFTCEGDRVFCIGCMLEGPGIATFLHFSEDPAVIQTIVEGSAIRLTLS